MTTWSVRGARTMVQVKAHDAHNQKHSISRDIWWRFSPVDPGTCPSNDLPSNSKSLPSCKYRKNCRTLRIGTFRDHDSTKSSTPQSARAPRILAPEFYPRYQSARVSGITLFPFRSLDSSP